MSGDAEVGDAPGDHAFVVRLGRKDFDGFVVVKAGVALKYPLPANCRRLELAASFFVLLKVVLAFEVALMEFEQQEFAVLGIGFGELFNLPLTLCGKASLFVAGLGKGSDFVLQRIAPCCQSRLFFG